MEVIVHRVNTIQGLKGIDKNFGTEIDIRSNGSELILNHEPFQGGENLINYLDEYQHGTIILNIKEAGIEKNVLYLIRQRPHIANYFLLDVEFPYLYQASRQGERSMAIRFSEDECIDTVEKYAGLVDWVWIDTITQLPISVTNRGILNQFKKCMVCPERWGQKNKIPQYLKKLKKIGVELDAVMTSLATVNYYI